MIDGKDNAEPEDPEDLDDPLQDELSAEGEHGSGQRRRRRRIKVRKRVRIKKKISPRKKAKKLIETIIWIIAIFAFIATLVMLVMQLELNSQHKPKKKSGIDKPINNYRFDDRRFYI